MIEAAREAVTANSKKPKVGRAPVASLDADDPIDHKDSDSDSDEDDTAALMAELQHIKKERATYRAKTELEERIRMENILSGNPLLNYAAQPTRTDMRVRRRWDEDIVFKNCARSEPKKLHDIFINDSLRSESHCKFMKKYVQ